MGGVEEAWSCRFLGNDDARISIRTARSHTDDIDQLFP